MATTVSIVSYYYNCTVFLEKNNNTVLDNDEVYGTTNNNGYVFFRHSQVTDETYLQVQSSDGPDNCFLHGGGWTPLSVELRSTTTALFVTPLTTLAMELLSIHGETNASSIVCENAVPCVSCAVNPLGDCNNATNCLDSCSGKSVFTFDAWYEYGRSSVQEPWAAWVVSQANVEAAVNCARNILTSHTTLSYSELNKQLFVTLSNMTTEGPLNLEASDGSSIINLATRTSNRLGLNITTPFTYADISMCVTIMSSTYTYFINS